MLSGFRISAYNGLVIQTLNFRILPQTLTQIGQGDGDRVSRKSLFPTFHSLESAELQQLPKGYPVVRFRDLNPAILGKMQFSPMPHI